MVEDRRPEPETTPFKCNVCGKVLRFKNFDDFRLHQDNCNGETEGYQSFDTEIGAQIEAGKGDFEMFEKKAMEWGEPKVASAKQELAEMIFQSAI